MEMQNSCDEDMPMRSVYKKEIHPLCKENPNRPPKKTLLPYDTDQAEFNFTHYEMKSMLHPDNLEQALLTHLKKKEDSGHKKIGGSMTLRKSDKFYIMDFKLYHFENYEQQKTEMRMKITHAQQGESGVCLLFKLLSGIEVWFYKHIKDLVKDVLTLPQMTEEEKLEKQQRQHNAVLQKNSKLPTI